MTKKIRLIDEPENEATESQSESASSSAQFEQLMKYAEAIDWKLWEILKLLRSQTEGK
jgi:hypothetical protein